MISIGYSTDLWKKTPIDKDAELLGWKTDECFLIEGSSMYSS